MSRRALGRGLEALLSAEKSATAADDLFEVEIGLIDPSPYQPRTHFAETALAELAQSIKTNGIVQPLLVRRHASRYELVAGERRWRAAQLAGLRRLPVVVRDIPDDKVLELALIENIQRENLNPIEEANAYKSLLETVGLTQESLAERIGRDRSYITNYVRLLKLSEDLQELVQNGKLSAGHARTLLGIEDVASQRRLARRIIDKGLSVRETEVLVRQAASVALTGRKRPGSVPLDANLRAAENRLRRRFSTQVRIVPKPNGAGRIELDYYDSGDLDRIYRLLIPLQEDF
jgi:ParB family transcriptional regulator, chromosome partitioning protein